MGGGLHNGSFVPAPSQTLPLLPTPLLYTLRGIQKPGSPEGDFPEPGEAKLTGKSLELCGVCCVPSQYNMHKKSSGNH